LKLQQVQKKEFSFIVPKDMSICLSKALNIKTVGKFILNIVQKIRPLVPSNKVVHKGRVIAVAPINIREGSTVITPDGIGEIRKIIPDWLSRKPFQADVYLYRGYPKRYRILNLQQYVILHKPTQQFILLSPNNYRYIEINEQSVEYRVTHRHYAQLTEDTKEHYEYAKSLNKTRYGIRFLRVLRNNNIELKHTK
jgi:hypothetical protein